MRARMMNLLPLISLLFLLSCCNSHAAAASRFESPTNGNLSRAAEETFYHLPYDIDFETNKLAYEPISMQAFSSGETLTITIKNTGEKDVILRSAGVHIRLHRTPFYVIQGKKKAALSLPGKLEIAAGEELHLSCSVNNTNSSFVHIGFVSLVVVGERVYDGLPERKIPIQHARDIK